MPINLEITQNTRDIQENTKILPLFTKTRSR